MRLIRISLTCLFLLFFIESNANGVFFIVDKFPPDTLKPVDTTISKSAITSTINYFARDSIPVDLQNNTITLYGEAWVTYEKIKLEAAVIKIDWKNELLYAEGIYDSKNKYIGAPKFIDNGQEYKAKKMVYNFMSRKGKLYELITKEGEGYIHGQVVKKDSQNNIYASKAKYTTCELEHPHYYISASKVEILQDKIISGPAYMVMEDVPIPLAVPFGFFPKKDTRSSGIILPVYGESNGRGFFLKGLGYYLGLNDYMDLTLKGDIYSHGSWLFNVGSNYAKRYKYSGNFNVIYAHNKYGDPETPEYALSKDFSVNWSHVQDPKSHPNSSFSANVNAGSQNSFRHNSYNFDQNLQNTLSSSISWSKRFPGSPFSMTASLTHSQNLSNKTINLNFPNYSFNVARINPFRKKDRVGTKKWYDDIGLSYALNFRNTINTYDSLFLKKDTWNQWKYGFKHDLPVSTSFKFLKHFTFTPSFRYAGWTYFSRITKRYEDTIIQHEEKGVYQLSEYDVSGQLTTRIYGMFNINRFKIIAIRHVMSPSLSFVYKPDFSNPPYDYYREVQIDSTGKTIKYSLYTDGIFQYPGIGRQGNIVFNLQNNLESKLKPKIDTGDAPPRKITLLESFGIGASYNIFADSMKLSLIRFDARTSLFKNKLGVQFSGTLDPYYITADSQLVNKFEIQETGGLGRITNMNISFDFSLNSPQKKDKKKDAGKPEPPPFAEDIYYVNFDVPWNVSFSYMLSYVNFGRIGNKVVNKSSIIQTISFSGNFNIAKKWKLDFRSGFDMETKKLSATSININRDLHCWQMSFTWIPFGYWQSYMFTLNVKSSVLKDLKIDKKRDYYDY